MKFLIALLLIISTIPVSAGATRWYDYEEGLLAASASEKPAIIDFYADWCGPCIAMEKGTYPDVRVVSEMSDFIAIKVDTQKRIDIEDKYGIAYYPTIVFLAPNGKEVGRHIGYLGPEEMVEEIKQWRGKLPKEAPGFETVFLIVVLISLGRFIK
ncbi:MAG TPA: thioredoxin domain-containing protein [Candidatus Methanoperedens sp.]